MRSPLRQQPRLSPGVRYAQRDERSSITLIRNVDRALALQAIDGDLDGQLPPIITVVGAQRNSLRWTRKRPISAPYYGEKIAERL